MRDSEAAMELDLRGLACPRLVLRLAESLKGAAPGGLYRVRATDPLSAIDIPFYLSRHGHALLAKERTPDEIVFLVRSGPNTPA